MSRMMLLAAALALAGCAHQPTYGGDPKLRLLDTGELPAPVRSDYSNGARPHYVGPGDKLAISVFGIDELAREPIVVDTSGRISMPLVGALNVNGKTPDEIERELIDRLRVSHVRDPRVAVNVQEVVSGTMTVGGQVNSPGLYPVSGRMTLLGAITRAGGTNEFSRMRDVVVFRTVENQKYAALYDLGAIQRGQYPDPEIYSNDVVMVDDSSSRRFFKDLVTVFPTAVIMLDRLTR